MIFKMVSTVKLVLKAPLGTLGSKSWTIFSEASSGMGLQAFLSHDECQYHHDSMTRVGAFRGSCLLQSSMYRGGEVTAGVCLLLCNARSSTSRSQK